MDIRLKAPYPASALSNLAAHSFVLDGVSCACIEGFLQSLKFPDSETQVDICGRPGPVAQSLGAKGSEWRTTQTLWWRGTPYARSSAAYQDLLDRAFAALAGDGEFRQALAATGSEDLTHTLGKHDPTQTVLTAQEFCLRLYALRARIQCDERGGSGSPSRRLRRGRSKRRSDPQHPSLRSLSEVERRDRVHHSYLRASDLLEFVFARGDQIASDFDELRRKVNITLSDSEWMDAALEGGYAAGGRAMLNAIGEYVLDADVFFLGELVDEEQDLSAEGPETASAHASPDQRPALPLGSKCDA